MRQGNDVGSQYRSAIYWTTPAQRDAALATKAMYEKALMAKGLGPVTTEIAEAGPRPSTSPRPITSNYLAKNPAGYAGWAAPASSAPSATGIAAE